MKTSDKGIEMIKGFEGLCLEAYRCAAGVWTIGYGHTKGVKPGMAVTACEAERLLKLDLGRAEEAVSQCGSLKQCQFDALVSFVFNVGVAAFNASTLKRLVTGNPDDIAIDDEFFRWRFATVNGHRKELTALAKRRLKESRLYFGKPI